MPGRAPKSVPNHPSGTRQSALTHFWALFLKPAETHSFAQISVFAIWALWLELKLPIAGSEDVEHS